MPLLLRLPRGLREQPAWIFIGFLVGLTGLSYLIGFSQSSISTVVGANALRVWGAFLAFSGFAVVYATFQAKPAFEKLALRTLSICMFVYCGWVLTVIDIRRAAVTTALVLTLVSMAEIRVAVLKALLRTAGVKVWH